MDTGKTGARFFGVLVLAIIATLIFYSTYLEKKDFQTNGKFTYGFLFKVSRGTRSGSCFSYSWYTPDSSYFKEACDAELPYDMAVAISNSHRPIVVMYISGNPGKSTPMITREDFSNLDLPFPDSLKWEYDFQK